MTLFIQPEEEDISQRTTVEEDEENRPSSSDDGEGGGLQLIQIKQEPATPQIVTVKNVFFSSTADWSGNIVFNWQNCRAHI